MSTNQNTVGGISRKQGGLNPGMIKILIAIFAVALIASFAIKNIDNAPVAKTVTATETTSEEVGAQTMTTTSDDGITEIVPREASEREINSIFEDPSRLTGALVTSNEYGNIFVGASLSSEDLPAIIYASNTKQEGVLIEGPYENNKGLYVQITNIGKTETNAVLYCHFIDNKHPPLLRSDYIDLVPGFKRSPTLSMVENARVERIGIILYY